MGRPSPGQLGEPVFENERIGGVEFLRMAAARAAWSIGRAEFDPERRGGGAQVWREVRAR
jgi:hypothetical protein